MSFQTVPLGSVAKIVNGGTPDTKVAAYWDGAIAWLTPKDMGKSTDPLTQHTSRTISAAGLANSSARLVPPGSVILSTRAPIGHLALNGIEMAFNQGCRGLVTSDNLDAKFLYYFLQANVRLLNDLGTGTTFKELSAGALANVQLPLPPITEQQRIVATLDSAYAAIEVADRAATGSLAALDNLLKSGVTSLLASLGADLREATLGELCEIYQPRTISTADMDEGGQYPVFGANGQIGRYNAYNHVEPQLLVTCRGATCGRINVSLPQSWITGNAMVVRPRTPELSLRFLRRLLEYGFDFRPVITGSAQPQITRQSLAPSVIAFPPQIEKQERLADAIEELVAETRAYKALLHRKLTLLAELKQSLLARAFSGELTREPLAA